MQDIHSIGGGARFFAGDRRLRPHNQPVNCPRCDSVNTKFCYYNNYNLSQPRHFCKSCRRYWTNGGVLRNVPVGGGCRKPKRSKPKQNPDSTSAVVSTADFTTQPPEDQLNSPDSHSSSESSSLSATATEVISVGNYSISEQNNKLIGDSSLNPSFETASFLVQGGECGMFQFQLQEMGSITSLTTSRAKETPSFDTPLSQGQSKDEEEWRMQGMIDPTIPDEYLTVLQSGRSSGAAGFGPLDWNEAGGGGGYFDLPPSGVDHVYWSQSQWNYD